MTRSALRHCRVPGATALVLGLLAGALAGPALAQTGPAKPPAGKPTTEKPAAPPAAPAQEAPPVRTETVTYGNWTATCRDRVGAVSQRTCSAILRITNTKSRQDVLIWEIGNDAANNPVTALRTPLGVMVKEGVSIALGSGKPRKLDYVLCDARGCEASGPFDAGFARELGAATEAAVSFTPINSKPVTLTIPLKGIADALAALRRQPR
ncbi:invasion associated locus B family protein [Ancylobacter sp. 6x-1]|uniref:Invasion associated locus B family protein n=1 Tax=Ancylobacter crimeensis TaxID=2579147 RepID=A0ABT0DB77_9HYPH|nr:invasion associated locus B family protein [Ancylobacter crimeensis]MCK0197154.1 invasion associated locus B family protein [Ancylobacter crimeensis]